MNRYKLFPETWQTFLRSLIILIALSIFGCNGTRFIFKGSTDIKATPREIGLAYEEVWFTNKDDIKLHAWLVPGNPHMPIVVFFYGNAANI